MTYGRDSYDRKLPEDFSLLCMLSNLGVTSRETALSSREIAERIRLEADYVDRLVTKLLDKGLVASIRMENIEKFYVTIDGVRRVLTLYS